MSVSKCGFHRDPAKRQRSAFCGKEEAPAPKAKVFRRKTEQLRRAPTTGRPYGGRTDHPQITNICLASRTSLGRAPAASEHALFSSVFVGATLRGRPFRNVNFAGLPQNANAVRFVGKRRRRRPKRRFFAGKPSKCAVCRRRVAPTFPEGKVSLLRRFFLFPKRHSLFGTWPCTARHIVHSSRTRNACV